MKVTVDSDITVHAQVNLVILLCYFCYVCSAISFTSDNELLIGSDSYLDFELQFYLEFLAAEK
jgi:hypothetical protein